jgi:hypothetical protein
MYEVLALPTTEHGIYICGSDEVSVFQGTQAECEAYAEAAKTPSSTPFAGWIAGGRDGDFEVRAV